MVDKKNLGTRYDAELKKVGAIIATNQQLYEIGKRVNPNTFLIPNGTDLSRFKPADPNLNFKRQFTVGFCGNTWGQGLDYKGYQFYVQATIRIYGEVEGKKLLHAYKKIKHENMPEKFYHLIDCLVLPSRGEGCSNIIVEALACGVPVLCTKVGYHGEMLQDRKTCLFIERDVQNIMDRIMELKNNPALRIELSENGRKFAEEHHDIKKIAIEYNRIFKMILTKNKK